MSKYILSILGAMGNTVAGNAVIEPSKYQHEITQPKGFNDDRLALQSDWNMIGSDFRKSANTLIDVYGN